MAAAFPPQGRTQRFGNWLFDGGVSTPGTGRTSTIIGGNAQPAAFTIGAGDTLIVEAQLINEGANARALTKNGSGTLTLSAVNSYTGGTQINAGKLLNNGAVAGAVMANATLGGTGTFTGSVVINSGAVLAPGTSVGTVQMNALTLAAGSALEVEFNSGGNDFVNVTGNNALTINGGSVRLYAEGTNTAFTTAGSYDLFGYAGTLAGSVANLTMANGVSSRSYTFTNDTARRRVVLTIGIVSSNASLSALSVSNASLSPAFASGTLGYSAAVRNTTSNVTVTAAAADAGATTRARINGGAWTALTSGAPSGALALNVGSNLIEIEVTAPAGNTLIYSINVARAAAGVEDWRVQYFGTTANSGIAANTANPDGDGLDNLQEFAFGTNPIVAQSNVVSYEGNNITPGAPTVMTERTQYAVNYFALYSRRKDYVSVGLSYTVQFSADLSIWVSSTATPTVRADNGTLQVVTVPYPFFINGRKAQFFRVVVNLP